MKSSMTFLFLIFSIQCLAWECEVNGKLNDEIKPEDHYEIASDVVFGTIINGYFTQTGERTRTYTYTFKIFHSFKGNLNSEQIITFDDGGFFNNFEIGSSYLITFNGNTKLEFCDYFFPLHIENRDTNIDSLRTLSENENFSPSFDLRRLLRFFDEGT
jgi:hypothetical protein